jgi:hypothetical protein
MATIVTRAGKGSPLTNNEVDANFTNLNSDKVETSAISTFGGTLIDDADAAAARTTLGLGTAATTASTDYATAAQGALAATALQSAGNLSDLADAATARTNLGLGTAATTASTDYATAAQGALAATALQSADNLSDLADAATARTNLGLGTAAVQADDRYAHRANNLSDLANAATARTNLGLEIGVDVQAYDADTAKLDVAQTFTAAQRGSTDTDATNTGSVTLDFATNQNFVLTLTGNVTLDNPTTEAVGQSGFIVFIQDGTGSRTVSLGTDYETAGGAGLTLSSAASATDVVPYIVAASGRILLGTPQLAFS